jgi:uncharacterized membrane protein
MKHYLLLYVATLLVMVLLDMSWIGGLARDFYKNRISNLEFHAVPAVLFYLIYAVGVVIFVNSGVNVTWQSTLIYGALFGFFAYATYDLTNLATLRGWSVELVIVDIAWGAFVTAISATAGLLITGYFQPR